MNSLMGSSSFSIDAVFWVEHSGCLGEPAKRRRATTFEQQTAYQLFRELAQACLQRPELCQTFACALFKPQVTQSDQDDHPWITLFFLFVICTIITLILLNAGKNKISKNGKMRGGWATEFGVLLAHGDEVVAVAAEHPPQLAAAIEDGHGQLGLLGHGLVDLLHVGLCKLQPLVARVRERR